MKKIAGVIVLCAISMSNFAQQKLDEAYLKCQYKFSFIKDTVKARSDSDDLLILQIGKSISKCYSYYSNQVDSLCETSGYERKFWDTFKKSMDKEGASSSSYYHKRLKTYVYKNYPTGKMTVTDGISTEAFIYEDSLSAIRWQLEDSTKSILGYSCQKAACDFRGRHYEAWFADSIPVSDGPWKFSGLPGLIMEVSDRGKQYAFTIIGLEKVNNDAIIFSKPVFNSGKYIKTGRREFLAGLKRYIKDAAGYIEAEYGISLPKDSMTKQLNYDLIERDY